MNMTAKSLQIYVEESSFKAEPPSPVALHPFYSTYMLWWIKQEQIRNSHLFVNNPDQANIIFSRGREFQERQDKANIILVTDKFCGKLKSKNSIVFNFTKTDISSLGGNQTKGKAPFDYSSLINLDFSNNTNVNFFSFSLFVNNIEELQEFFFYWRSKPHIQGTIYAFCLYRDIEDNKVISIIDQYNQNNQSKTIRLYYIGQSNLVTVVNAMAYSRFVICLIDNSVYPFWSLRVGSYPVIRKSSSASSYLPHVCNEHGFFDIIEYFWNNHSELVSKNDLIKKIVTQRFDLGYLLSPLQAFA